MGLGHFKVQDAVIPLEGVLPAFDGASGGGLGTLLRLLKPLHDGTPTRTAAGGGVTCPMAHLSAAERRATDLAYRASSCPSSVASISCAAVARR